MRTALPSTLTLLGLSRLQCVRIGFVIQRHVSEFLTGDDLESTLGSAPGVLEDQVCIILIHFRHVSLNRNVGQLSQGAAVGYVGMPSDIAALVSFLASKESHLITGQSVSISAPNLSAPFVSQGNLQISIDGGRFFD